MLGAFVGTRSHVAAWQDEATPTAVASREGLEIVVVGGESSVPGRPIRGGSLRLDRPGAALGDFNPSALAQDQQISLSYLEPLVRPDPVTMRPMPWLASRWEWFEQGLELELTIRNGVVWHDGTSFTAADAAFSFSVYREDLESVFTGLFALVTDVSATSDSSLRVTFSERDAMWLFNAATLPVFSRHQYADFWSDQPEGARSLSGFDWGASLPVGTGPWQVQAWTEQSVQFGRFNRYWRSPAWFDSLEVGVDTGARNRLSSWTDDRSDMIWPLPAREINELKDGPGRLYVVPAASVMFAAFNFANPAQPNGSVWSDLRVRQAVSMAIDRERYANEVFGGYMRWSAAGTVAQPWANDSDLTNPSYNPQAAAALLGEAEWIDYTGDGQRVDPAGNPFAIVAIMRRDSRPELAAILARVARDLAAVGITLTIEALTPDDFDDRWIVQRDYDLIAYAYDELPGFTDVDLYGSAWDIRHNPVGWNPGGYANAEADAAIDEYLSAQSITRQREALLKLQKAANDDLFGLWFGFPNDLVLVADHIDGFKPNINWQTADTAGVWESRRPNQT
ncbi:MAG: ABC transporter substrate-binding protein [Thermomicrobiales bacterium]